MLQIDDEEAQFQQSSGSLGVGDVVKGEEIFVVNVDDLLSRYLFIILVGLGFMFYSFIGLRILPLYFSFIGPIINAVEDSTQGQKNKIECDDN